MRSGRVRRRRHQNAARLDIAAEHLGHRFDDLAFGRERPHGVDQGRHHVDRRRGRRA